MFIIQVIFESEKQNEEILKKIVKEKLDSAAAGIEGLISSECWAKPGKDTIGYALVNKWESRAQFVAWMSKTRPGAEGSEEGVKITTTAFQFEAADL